MSLDRLRASWIGLVDLTARGRIGTPRATKCGAGVTPALALRGESFVAVAWLEVPDKAEAAAAEGGRTPPTIGRRDACPTLALAIWPFFEGLSAAKSEIGRAHV